MSLAFNNDPEQAAAAAYAADAARIEQANKLIELLENA